MMAGAGGTGTTPPPTPLRLKDLLELDCDSCSAAGFRCYPRRLGSDSSSSSVPAMRHILESSSRSLSLRRHRRPSKLSHLSRSLSRRLSRRGGFWRRRGEEGEDDAAAATATAASAGCGGSCSSEELETSSSESSDNSSVRTSRRSPSESDSDFSSATEDSVHHHPSQDAGAGDEHEVEMMKKRVVSKDKEGSSSSSGSEADDKEQLSPVAVMDFPFDDDEDEDGLGDAAGVACSSPPSFSLARLQRRKIRRFGSRDELMPPLDLEARLATTSSDPDGPAAADPPPTTLIQCRTGDAAAPTCAGGGVHGDVADEDDDLTSLLTGTVSAGLDDVSERLLLDFFVETKRRRRSEAHAEAELPLTGPAAGVGALGRKADERVVDGEAVAAAARGWLEGTGTELWGLADVLGAGAAIMAEMERVRRWMHVGEEEREVGAVVAGMLADELVDEVVRCLFV